MPRYKCVYLLEKICTSNFNPKNKIKKFSRYILRVNGKLNVVEFINKLDLVSKNISKLYKVKFVEILTYKDLGKD